jgi:hypothetical protein
MNTDDNLGSLFAEIKKDVTAFLNVKLKIFQLNIYEKGSRTLSFLLMGLVLMFVIFFAILFIFLALGFYLGEVLKSAAAGMGLVALLSLLILLVLFLNRTRFQLWLMELFLSEMTKDDDEDEE